MLATLWDGAERQATLRLIEESTCNVVATGVFVGFSLLPEFLLVRLTGDVERYAAIVTADGYEAVRVN
jgi:hypothetical protein